MDAAMDEGTIDTHPLNVVFTSVFVWGGVGSNFVGSESGQKQSVKPLQNMDSMDYGTIRHQSLNVVFTGVFVWRVV